MTGSRFALILSLTFATEGAFAIGSAMVSAASALPAAAMNPNIKMIAANRARDVYSQEVMLQAQRNAQLTSVQPPQQNNLGQMLPLLFQMGDNKDEKYEVDWAQLTPTEQQQYLRTGKVTLANGRTIQAKQIIYGQAAPTKMFDPVPSDKSCGEISVGNIPMPCAALNRSMSLLKRCSGYFPNKKFIVVNDYSRPYNGSFGSWIVPIAWENGEPKLGKGVVRYPVSNGKSYDGMFCSANGQNQTPAGFHMTNIGHHSTEKKYIWPGRECIRLPGISNCNEAPKIGMVGIEPGINAFKGARNGDSSLNRGVLIHGGEYAGRQGASLGCSVVGFDAIKDYWDKVGGQNGGALVYNFPGENFAGKSCGRDKSAAATTTQKMRAQEDISCADISWSLSAQGRTEQLRTVAAQAASSSRAPATTVKIEDSKQ